jgi:hypothetical protein
MGKIMKLIDVIKAIDSFDDELTIYASEPWRNDSLAIVDMEADDGLPQLAKEKGLTYFLEVFVALEFMEDWLASLKKRPSDEDICMRLIEYAINDA